MTRREFSQEYPHQQVSAEELQNFTPRSNRGLQPTQLTSFGKSFEQSHNDQVKMNLLQNLAAKSSFAQTYGSDITTFMKNLAKTDQGHNHQQQSSFTNQPVTTGDYSNQPQSLNMDNSWSSLDNHMTFDSLINSPRQENPYTQKARIANHVYHGPARQRITCQLWTFQLIVDKVFYTVGRSQLTSYDIPRVLQELYDQLRAPLPPPEHVTQVLQQFSLDQQTLVDVNLWRNICLALFDPTP